MAQYPVFRKTVVCATKIPLPAASCSHRYQQSCCPLIHNMWWVIHPVTSTSRQRIEGGSLLGEPCVEVKTRIEECTQRCSDLWEAMLHNDLPYRRLSLSPFPTKVEGRRVLLASCQDFWQQKRWVFTPTARIGINQEHSLRGLRASGVSRELPIKSNGPFLVLSEDVPQPALLV